MAIHPALARIDEAAQHVRSIDNALTDAFLSAEGAAADNTTDNPSLICVWKQRRMVFFQIDESVVEFYKNRHDNGDDKALGEFNVYLNAVIIRGFQEWTADFTRRIPTPPAQ